MALRYHWGLGIGHTYSHHVACDASDLVPAVQSDASCQDMYIDTHANGSGSSTQAEKNSTFMDNVVDDEDAESMLVDREALDWEEDPDNEETKKINGDDYASDSESEDDGNSRVMDMYDELGSDPEWIDTED